MFHAHCLHHIQLHTNTQDEWELYKEIRENCSFKTTWFEVVGNHDTMMQFVRFLSSPS